MDPLPPMEDLSDAVQTVPRIRTTVIISDLQCIIYIEYIDGTEPMRSTLDPSPPNHSRPAWSDRRRDHETTTSDAMLATRH